MKFSLPLLSTLLAAMSVAAISINPLVPSIRIEGASGTIFEGPILARPGTLNLPSGGSHKCDGTNNGQNPVPGPTCTNALAAAATRGKFFFDGTWDSDFEDFFIVAIGNSAQTATQFWGLLLNWQFTPVGGCQQQIQAGDEVLYAFDAFNKSYFLKLALVGAATARVGDTVSFTVTDGTTGSVIPAATVAAISGGSETSATDRGGFVSIMLLTPGRKTFKAERSDSIRSNAVQIVVS